MTGYSLITADEIAAFEAAIRDEGLKTHDFELQEEVFDPQTAEVEARKGNVGIRCLRTAAVAAYPLGDGSDWVASFAAELGSSRFSDRPR